MEIEIMAKRFTATEKWTDPWFCGLSDNNKLFWLYLLDNCDNAGIWRVNWFIFGCYVKNYTYNPELFKSRIIILDEEKWFIPKFVEFQYGKLNPACVPHLSVIKLLEKHTVTQGYLKGWLTLKDKDMDKDKVKDKSMDTTKVQIFDFEPVWASYPNKDGKKDAVRHFRASVRTQEDYDNIVKAIENYKQSDNVKKGFIKNGSTFFNNWTDWVDFKGVSKNPINNSAAPIPGKYSKKGITVEGQNGR